MGLTDKRGLGIFGGESNAIEATYRIVVPGENREVTAWRIDTVVIGKPHKKQKPGFIIPCGREDLPGIA